MYQFRLAHLLDLSWLDQAVAAGAWEALSPEERMVVHPVMAARQGQMQLRQMLSAPGSAALVALHGPRPVGYLVMGVGPDSSTEEPTVHLVDLWVAPAHRRRRVGSQLLRLVEQLAASQGLRKLKLWSGLHNQSVVSWAERNGFAPAGLIGVKDL